MFTHNCKLQFYSNLHFLAANIILAGGWGEWRLRIDDDELAIAKDTKHGQLLLRTAIGPLARESAVVGRPSRSNAASSRCPFQSEVGGQSARLDTIPRPRYVVLPLLLFFATMISIFAPRAMRSCWNFDTFLLLFQLSPIRNWVNWAPFSLN